MIDALYITLNCISGFILGLIYRRLVPDAETKCTRAQIADIHRYVVSLSKDTRVILREVRPPYVPPSSSESPSSRWWSKSDVTIKGGRS